ncbi:MAG: S9 family peptidase [Vicinamibacteria bacterium]|nr:S9 family peptidase [Vicinamibacteria bacterium]
MRALVLIGFSVFPALAGADTRVPGIDDLVALKRVSQPAISPDGARVAWVVRKANWDDNAFENEIWLGEVQSGNARPFTQAKKSSDAPAFSPDGSWLAFLSDRDGKRQIYLMNLSGGESRKLTSGEEGVTRFAYSHDGKRIAFLAPDPKTEAMKEREKLYGEVVIEDEATNPRHLHVIDLETNAVRRLTTGTFVAGDFDWSPDDKEIAFDFTESSDPSFGVTSNISVVDVETATVRPLVTQEGPDSSPRYSPDGRQIAFTTAMLDVASFYYKNATVATISSKGDRSIRLILQGFDEDPQLLAWTKAGIFLSANQKTESALIHLDPVTKTATRVALEQPVASNFSFSAGGVDVAFVGSSARTYPEVFAGSTKGGAARKLSDLGSQLGSFALGQSEVVSWKSADGTTIEGVLRKPAGYKTGTLASLLVIIHGGPTGVSRPSLLGGTYVYPMEAWLAKGALILEPNYRGSAGYGEAFRSLNVRNLGVGDAWDVMSGIDSLIAKGLVDKARVGVMGWSQGGYISAFLTTHDSARFRAVSVGAGISNWVTYYVSTDIHPFTRQYLKTTPWDDPEIYRKTSPMTYIKGAKAPTLIQHGDSDQRVPVSGALELYQGLRDQGVDTRVALYKGFGHGLNKPKAVRHAMQENLDWFNRHLFGF